MLRGIVFDLDGVLVDSHPAHKRAWKMFFASLGKQVSNEELEFVLEGQKRADILRHFLGNLTDQQVKDYGDQKDAFFKNELPGIKITHGLPLFLEQVITAGIAMALASSASRGRVEHTLQQLHFNRRFQAVVTGDDVPRGKPDPAIFMLAASRMNLCAGEILVCEDAVNGVAGAKAAGMKCLAIAANGRGPLLEKAGADKVISDFSEAKLDELCGLFA